MILIGAAITIRLQFEEYLAKKNGLLLTGIL